MKRLAGVKKIIRTAKGDAEYIGTEIEDKYGRWNNNWLINRGEWVIHEGKKHHVYVNKPNRQDPFGFVSAIDMRAIDRASTSDKRKLMKALRGIK